MSVPLNASNRITFARNLARRAVGLEDLEPWPVHAGDIEGLDDVLNEAGEGFVFQRRAGDLLEEVAEKRIGARDEGAGLFAGELTARPSGAGGEEAVGERLRKHVGKLGADLGFLLRIALRGELREERGGKSGAPVAELVGSFAVSESLDDGVAHHVREVSEAQGEVLRRSDADGALGEEAPDELESAGLFLGMGDDLAAGGKMPERRHATLFHAALALHIPAELQVIRKEEIRKVRLVAFDLLALFHLGQIEARIFGLNIAQREAILPARDHVVGRATLHALWFVRSVHFRQRFNQLLEIGSVGVLRGIVPLTRPLDLRKIFRWGHTNALMNQRCRVEHHGV